MKVIIELEDLPENKVRVTATPSFEEMMAQMVSGTELTSAQGYAATALNAINREAKRQDPTKIFVPRVGH